MPLSFLSMGCDFTQWGYNGLFPGYSSLGGYSISSHRLWSFHLVGPTGIYGCALTNRVMKISCDLCGF